MFGEIIFSNSFLLIFNIITWVCFYFLLHLKKCGFKDGGFFQSFNFYRKVLSFESKNQRVFGSIPHQHCQNKENTLPGWIPHSSRLPFIIAKKEHLLNKAFFLVSIFIICNGSVGDLKELLNLHHNLALLFLQL